MNEINNLVMFDYNFKQISTLNSELKCCYLINYFQKFNKSIILVTNTLYEANYMYQSLIKYNSNVLLFPMDDFLTSEALAISPELKVTRLETLNDLLTLDNKIIVTNLMGYLRFLPLKAEYLNSFITLKKNNQIKIKELINFLFNLGYTRETIVNKTGEIAVRGFVVDVFPISEKNPIRIEFWGDEIYSIREFNVDTQLTINELDSIIIKPNSECIINNKDIDHFKLKQRDLIKYSNVCNIRNYLNNFNVFYNNYEDLLVSKNLLINEINDYIVSQEIDSSTKFMFDFNELESSDDYKFFDFDNDINNIDSNIHDIMPFVGSNNDINVRLNKYLINNKYVVICVSNRYLANKIIDELHNDNIVFTNINEIYNNKINLVINNVTEGFIYDNIVVISESEIFNKKDNNISYKTNFKIGTKIRDLSKLQFGDYVVHQVHGIGKYLGIKMLIKNGMKKDYLTIEYKDGDKLYIPVEKIDVITKYSCNEGIVPKISKLGGTEWAKTKLRVREKAASIAKDLLKLYAEREEAMGFSFLKDDDTQIEFEKEFSFVPTADQIRVTEEIKKDMESPHPMDRLVCGDVGFGKTEVAFRAVFKAIMSNKQVAFLCPTTILSQQHYQNAINRFKSFPINIAILNRFVSPTKVKNIISNLKEGKIDLLIGTHRILSEDIEFKKLGLLIIDEEQRFGVKHKEKIKSLKNNIDVLTLSATPIPRTLQMSMTGLRSLSLLETAPSNRYPVQTYVLSYSKPIIKDAIYKELSRKGQVFILYNNIKDMDEKYREIHSLVPEARIVLAHGQMSKNNLEDIMFEFVNHKYDVLLCTTIIETGIDIPNVNTLIIMDADKFGLSQLYQIRGRVGRSDKIAYCYLMYKSNKILNEIAVKRLKVIKEFTELGSGFSIAMRDLSIRGAGNILGSEQSGYIDSVGIELFLKMLNEEINILKGYKNNLQENINVEPLVEVETNISDKYVEEEDLKIEIHRLINKIDSFDKIEETKNVLLDRFGTIPENLIIYMYEEWFEKIAGKLGITHIKQNKNSIEVMIPIELTNKIDGEKLFMELYSISRMFRLSMKNRQLIITLDTIKLDKHFIYYLINMIDCLKRCIKK